jgi:CBS domain-containing protein
MTPHPDTVSLDTTILQALKKMHAGHYLHLPVVNSNNKVPIALVDVLQLSYNTLEQVR